MSKSRQSRDEAVEKLYAAEAAALERAENTLTRQQLSSAVYEPFRELAKHYRRMLKQTMKITAVSDATQLQLRQTSRELADALKKVESLNRELRAMQDEKDELFAMAVHDLRSPLASISGLASFIGTPGESTPDEHREMGRDILGLAEGTLLLVNDLVDLYRFESTTPKLQATDHELGAIGARILGALQPFARKKHSQIRLLIDEPKTKVWLDQEFFLRVAANLISNALKYSPAGMTVTVKMTREGDNFCFKVSDQGPGISQADQKKLFRKFVRLSARPTGGETSSGLGLAIVKRIVDFLGGKVGCDSELGRGATFYVVLPAAKPELA